MFSHCTSFIFKDQWYHTKVKNCLTPDFDPLQKCIGFFLSPYYTLPSCFSLILLTNHSKNVTSLAEVQLNSTLTILLYCKYYRCFAAVNVFVEWMLERKVKAVEMHSYPAVKKERLS